MKNAYEILKSDKELNYILISNIDSFVTVFHYTVVS